MPGSGDPVIVNNGSEDGGPVISYGDAAAAEEMVGDTYDSAPWVTGTITQSGGTNATTNLYVGFNYGTGIYNQTGGSTTISSTLWIGTYFPSAGSYTLGDSASLSVGGAELVGNGGTGNFYQTGGINSCGTLGLGCSVQTGTYALSGEGSLLASGGEYVGYYSTGVFTQSGGTNIIGNGSSLYIGYYIYGGLTGTYDMHGGTLSTQDIRTDSGNGTFTMDGGTVTFSGWMRAGINQGSTANYTITGGSLTNSDGGLITVGESGTGTLSMGGDAVVSAPMANSSLFVGWSSGGVGMVNLSGNASFSVGGNESIGSSGTGTFTQTGGTNTVAGTLTLAANTGSTGSYSLQGGALTAGAIVVNTGGAFSNGSNGGTVACLSFNQTGGTASFATITIDPGDIGAYSLSGGSLSVNGAQYVGEAGTGGFSQTGGTSMISSDLVLGDQSGSTGSYTLSSTGSLVVGGSIYVGNNGVGNFTQTGGTNTVDVTLTLGNNPGSSGAYTLSAGALTVGGEGEIIGNAGVGMFSSKAVGAFNQSGGLNTASIVYLGYGIAATGTYTLSGTGILLADGSQDPGLFTGGEEVGFAAGTGIFTQTGGTNGINNGYDLDLGVFLGSSGTYALSGGTTNVSGSVYVGGYNDGVGGTGVLTVSGTGILNIGGALTAYDTVGNSIKLKSGTINTAALDFNGAPSLFKWTAGTLGFTNSVTFDSGAPATSTAAAFGSSLTLGSGQELNVGGDETIGGAGPFSLTLKSGSIDNLTGTLTIEPTGTLTLNSGSTLSFSNYLQNGGTAALAQILIRPLFI